MVFSARLRCLIYFSLLFLAACANPRSKADELTHTLKGYEVAVRWGDGLGDATKFLDPDAPAETALSSFEMARFAQMSVIGYRVQSPAIIDENNVASQQVLIELVNRHTQTPRSIIDVQRWRFEPKGKRWLLISGLPNLNKPVNP
jgi:hypothetical protein